MKLTNKFLLGCAVIFLSTVNSFSQNVAIKLGKNEIGINQYFTVTVQVENDRLKQYSDFPNIEGFIKRGTSSSTTTNYVNGRMSSTQSLTQNYQATEKGTFLLQPFFMTINGEEVKSEGTQIVVGEAVQRQARQSPFSRDPFDDLFGGRSEPEEFLDIKADAFVALTLDKDEVYVGEGFTATLAFYVAESNRAEMRFYNLANQITEIVKTVKPPNCWEENFSIDQISGEPITIGGKAYDRYKIYQTTYYPLTLKDIEFPSIGLKMIKFKVAKNPSFFGRNRQEDYETFYSKEKTVKVKDLPAHPMKDQVAVGNYRLDENISNRELETGQSFNYSFNIVGEGNISSIEAPTPKNNDAFDFYAPNVTQRVNRAAGKVSGVKSYDFYAIPNEPGEFKLGDYFYWVFFNPENDSYDTLRSEYSLNVSGESRKNLTIASNDLGDFYDKIGSVDNELEAIGGDDWVKIIVNIFIALTLGFTAYLLFKKTA
ncbi:Oxygen tolerance [Ekhidna lutea]|uniref:Oxygen tolerance n=1 Tax=Ekhidna lutea TaxID=447679 RepID=A0A239IP33_EKHLU|nr:BatD family protein [Ekhidna lutea]SNS94174.1 Oxygen tolerance [Ekhidna lutea]